MILQYPDMPDGKIIRPALYLLGSINEATAPWQRRAAQMAEDRVGTVIYTVDPECARWSMLWLCQADLVAMWLEPQTQGSLQWTEFEFGFVMGLARSGRMPPPLVGVHPLMLAARRAISRTIDALGFPVQIYDQLEEIMHAAQML